MSTSQEYIFDDEASPRTDMELETPTHKKPDGGRKQKFFSAASSHLREKRPGLQRSGGKHATDADNDNNSEGGRKVLSATSAALTRFKGLTLRSSSTGKVITPRSVTMVTGATTSRKKSKDRNNTDYTTAGHGSSQTSTPVRKNSGGSRDEMAPPTLVLEVPAEGEELTPMTVRQAKLEAIFDDSDEESDNEEDRDKEGGENQDALEQEDQEYAASPRSRWAATLMASTIARAKSTGKTPAIGGHAHMLPHPRDSGNNVRERRWYNGWAPKRLKPWGASASEARRWRIDYGRVMYTSIWVTSVNTILIGHSDLH